MGHPVFVFCKIKGESNSKRPTSAKSGQRWGTKAFEYF